MHEHTRLRYKWRSKFKFLTGSGLFLVTWLLLLAAVEGEDSDAGDLDDLEADPGKISLGMSRTTESGHEDLVVLLHEVKATIVGHEGNDLLSVLDQLDADALTNSGVRLLGLDTDLLEHDALGVGGSSEGIGLDGGSAVALLPLLVGPTALAAKAHQLTGSVLSVDLGHYSSRGK